jgi:hypothetical protein
MGTSEGVVEPAGHVQWPVAGHVAAGSVEQIGLDLDQVRT